jgi:hypothetical protein
VSDLALRLVTLVHVGAGALVLVVAPAAMISRKGGRWHRGWGLAFASGMAFVLATAAFMWQPHGHLFLLFLDFVSAYLVFTGFRTIARRRRRIPEARADRIDALAAGLVLACAAALAILGFGAQTTLLRSLAAVLVALGAIAVSFAFLDLRAIVRRRQTRLGSLLMHLSAMIAAYISAVTAFCVINFHGVPMGLRWLVPSLAGSVVIGAFSIAYRRRFARSARTSAAGAAPEATPASGDRSLIPTR